MASPLFLREPEIRRGVELLYFGYAHLTRSIDAGLAAQGLGRAHHRALYFIARKPDLTVSELLAILAITKQSLGRVLTELSERGFVETRTGERDRRPRASGSRRNCSTRCARRCPPPIRARARARSAASGRCSRGWCPRRSGSGWRRWGADRRAARSRSPALPPRGQSRIDSSTSSVNGIDI